MGERWDAQGNPVADTPAPAAPGGGVQRWDATGKPVATPQSATAPAPTQAAAQPDQPNALQRFGTNAWDEAKGIVQGTYQAATAPPTTPIDKALHVMGQVTGTEPLAMKRLLVDPAIQKGKSTVQALRSGDWMKAGLGAAATLDPMAPDVTKLYEQSAGGDVAGAMGRGFTDVAALKGLDLVKDAAKLINRAPTIEQGKIGYVNVARRAADKLDNAVRTSGVGARANQVIAADATHNAQTNSPGYVNGVAATNAMQNVINQTHMGGVAHGFPAQMSMADAKATMTQLGREASRLERTGKAPEAASVWAAYDALRDETMIRARALDTLQPGAGHAKAWGDYAKEFRNYIGLQSGVLGHLTEGEHTASLNGLIDHEGQLPELKQWFKKYNVDFSPIEDAAKQGKILNELGERTSNALMGKIKMIARHPVVGIPMIMAEAKGIKALGMGGGLGGFVLPLIIAAKIGKVLDNVQIHSILSDLGERLSPEDMQVSGSPQGPYNAMQGPIGPGGPAQPTPPPGPGNAPPTGPTTPGAGGVPPANIPPSPFGGAGPAGANPAAPPPNALAQQLGLIPRPPSAPGLVSFQDSTTGGSIEMREGFTNQQLVDKVNQHRESINVDELHPALAGKVARARAARGAESTPPKSEAPSSKTEQAAKVSKARDDAPNPTPDRRAIVGRGAHGQVIVEFPDANYKDLYSIVGRSHRQMRGEGGIKPDIEGVAARMNIPKEIIYQVARDYRDKVMAAIKDKPEGTTYVAPALGEEH